MFEIPSLVCNSIEGSINEFKNNLDLVLDVNFPSKYLK